MLTPHSPAFVSALDAVTALLGAPTSVEHRPMLASVATWDSPDAEWTLDDFGGEVALDLTLPDGRSHGRIIDPPADTAAMAVAACCERLGWPMPRPTLPGLAPRPVDHDGAPRSTTGGPMGEGDW